MGFPGVSTGKESTCNVGDPGLTLGLGRSPGEGNSYLLQYSGLENFMDSIVIGLQSQTRLSDFHRCRNHGLPKVFQLGREYSLRTKITVGPVIFVLAATYVK